MSTALCCARAQTCSSASYRQSATGAFNWCLFKVGGGGPGASGFGGDMSFINAGSLSVPEMVRCLPPDEACLGLLRLGFGTGRL